MKICPKCKKENEDHAHVCYNCGRRFTSSLPLKRLMMFCLFIIIIAVIGGGGYGIWYFLQPKYYIYPELDKITMNGDGDTIEIKINTDAPYNVWSISSDSWINVTKKESSIIIECNRNDDYSIGDRKGAVRLYCHSVRNSDYPEAYIYITQGEDTKTIRGEIKKVSAYYTNNSEDLAVEVKCRIHNMAGIFRGILWFFHKDGTKLMDMNRKFCDSGGQVSVQELFYYTPSDDYTLKMSIPISELHLSKSEEIRIAVVLIEYDSDSDGREFARREDKSFYVAM